MATDRLILIDGYNLILRTPTLRPGKDRTLQEARDKLINLLSWAVGDAETRFLVVFDGAEVRGREEAQGRVAVRFSRPPQKADDLIRTLVEERVETTERLTVVTSDVEIARHARAMGAEVALADLFLASVLGPTSSAPEEKPTTLTRKELEEWASLFRRGSPRRPEDEPDDREDG